jgi:hypothetical protein
MPISHRHTKLPQLEYIEEKNAELSYKMGEVKQNAYNENVSSLNKYFDSLADFEPTNKADRDFYKSELNRINQSLNNSVSNADFSNINTVKSLISIGNPLMKDERFKNIVASENELQRRQKFTQELLTKNPKAFNEANYHVFMEDYDQWLNRTEPGVKLNYKEYIPYNDISESFQKRVKDMTPQIEETIRKKYGMIETEQVKMLSAAAIARNLMNTMDSQELQQYQIDKRYAMRGISTEVKKEQLQAEYKNYYDNKLLTKNEYDQMLKNIATPDGLETVYNSYFDSKYFSNIGEMYQVKEVTKKLQNDPYALASFEFNNIWKEKQRIQQESAKELWSYQVANPKPGSEKESKVKIGNDNYPNILNQLNKTSGYTPPPEFKDNAKAFLTGFLDKSFSTTVALGLGFTENDGTVVPPDGTEFKDFTDFKIIKEMSGEVSVQYKLKGEPQILRTGVILDGTEASASPTQSGPPQYLPGFGNNNNTNSPTSDDILNFIAD